MSRRSIAFGAGAAVFLLAITSYGWWTVGRPEARLRAELRDLPLERQTPIFAKYLPSLGAARMLDMLEGAVPYCHGTAHPLGMAIFDATHDLHEAIETCGNRCTGGCFHGVLTSAVRAYASSGADNSAPVTFEQVLAHGREICDRPDAQGAERKGSCVHGIGHAFTFLAGHDMARAIDACRTFPGPHLQYYCASGAYMERDMQYGIRDAVEGAPLAPCDRERSFPAACYRYKIAHLFRRGQTLETVAQACLGLSDHQRLGCFHGLGYAQQLVVAERPAWLGTVCATGDANDRKMCVEGVMYSLSNYRSSVAPQACASVPPELASHCHNAIRDGLYALDKSMDLYVAPNRQ